MKFLIDNQLPRRLVVYLRSRGHECRHVIDQALDEASDLELWTRAGREDWVVVAKDEDFFFLANRPGDTGKLVWVRLGNCRNSALVEAFDRSLEGIVAAIEGGQRIVELR
jgi:predicted nuclease of predicted toxin-antitoxin system